jgi:hypothetical protein
VSLRWSLASQQLWAVVISTAPFTGSLDRSTAALAAALAERLLFAGWPESLQQPVHHWHLRNSNPRAVLIQSIFQ